MRYSVLLFISLSDFLLFLQARPQCESWCSNPCEELKGNVKQECGGCDINDPGILCFGNSVGKQHPYKDEFNLKTTHNSKDQSHLNIKSYKDDDNILDHCDLERVSMEHVSRSLLLEAKEPFLIVNATEGWSAHDKWTRENFLSEHGNKAFTVSPKGIVTVAQMMKTPKYHMGHVLFSTHACYSEPWRPYTPFLTTLHNDYNASEIFQPYATFQMGVGVGKGTGVPPEQHPSSWFAVIAGPKRWAIHPPDIEKPPELMARYGNSQFCAARKSMNNTLFCTQKKGDVLWLPSYWWHETCNLEYHSIGMGALTYDKCCDFEPGECQQNSNEPGITFNVNQIDWCKTNDCPTLHKGRMRQKVSITETKINKKDEL